MKDPIGWRLLRWSYGGYFILLGVATELEMLGLLQEPHWDRSMSAGSAAFLEAMLNTGYLIPLIGLVWTASGVALLFQRTAPLGVALLTPVMVNIVLADTILDIVYLWAVAHAAPLLLLAWRYRSAFRGLWNYYPAAGGKRSF